MSFSEKVNGGSILKERNPTRSLGKPTLVLRCQIRSKVPMRYIRLHPYLMGTHLPWKHRGGVAVLRGKYWPEVLWSENGLEFRDTGGRLKNYSTGFYCPENFDSGDNLRGVEWGFDVVEDNGVRYLERFNCSFLV